MLLYKLLPYWVLGTSFNLFLALADLGPFFRSISYEHTGHGKWPQQTYHSSDNIGPILNVQRYIDACDNGQYTLLSVTGSEVSSAGPTILDERGNLVWNRPYGRQAGLDVQMLDGQPYLTFCSWPAGVAPLVTCHMLNSEYEEAFKIRAKNGWDADGTEFQITQQKTAVLTTSKFIPYDLTPVHGSEKGRIRDVGFQEIDLTTGELLFEWSWSAHWNMTDVVQFPNGTEGTPDTWDPFHINSVQKDTAGNYLVSARHVSTVGYVNGRTGEFIWKLGGRQNMFEDLSEGAATGISMQHHARFFEGDSTLTLFDNGVSPDTFDFQSRGLMIDIDVKAMTAKVRHEYLSPQKIGSKSRGSMQVLENGHVLLGYGVNAGWSEFSMEGDLLCDVHFGPEMRFGRDEVLSYRVLKRNWIGDPKTPPNIEHQGDDVYVSWNGATEVATWVLLAADADISDFIPLASVRKEGFETRIPVPTNMTTLSLRAVGLDSHDKVLGSTSVLHLVRSAKHAVQAPLAIE
ncbi:MAG: hypothetical protein Q9195_008849 [Heterodermia aff. obscurata]